MLKAACGYIPGNMSKGRTPGYSGQVQNADTGSVFWACEHKHTGPITALRCAEEKLKEVHVLVEAKKAEI